MNWSKQVYSSSFRLITHVKTVVRLTMNYKMIKELKR